MASLTESSQHPIKMLCDSKLIAVSDEMIIKDWVTPSL